MQRPISYDFDPANTALPYYRDDADRTAGYTQDARRSMLSGNTNYAPQVGYAAPAQAGYYVPPQANYYAPADDMTTTMAGDVLAAQDISVLNPQRFGWQAAGLQAPHTSHGGNTTAMALGNVPEGDEESLGRAKTPVPFEVEDSVPAAKPSRRKRYIALGVLGLFGVGGAVAGGILGTRKHSSGSAAAASTLSAQLGSTTTPASVTFPTTAPVSQPSSSPSTTARTSTTTTSPSSTNRRTTTSTSTTPTSTPTSTLPSTSTRSTTTTPPRSTTTNPSEDSISAGFGSAPTDDTTTPPPSTTSPVQGPSDNVGSVSVVSTTVDGFGSTGVRLT